MNIPLKYSIIILTVYLILIYEYETELSRFQRTVHLHIFDPSTDLITISPIFSKADMKFEVISEYTNKENDQIKPIEYFHIDNSNYLPKNLKCNPVNMGYIIKNGLIVFPNKTYPQCWKSTNQPIPFMNLDYQTNSFSMACKKGTPYYILEPRERKNRLYQYNELRPYLKSKIYTEAVKLDDEDFVYGSCDNQNFNNAIHAPRFNKTLYDYTKKK
jgi:hypothetical protein